MASDAAYLLALNSIHGIGPVGVVSIATRFKTPEDLASAPTAALSEALGEKCAGLVRAQLNNGWQSLLVRSQSRVTDHLTADIRPLAITEADYPPLLRLIPDPPPVLYAKGNIDILKVLDAIAIIGTRSPTALGVDVASRAARRFAQSGFVVVSGLAKGIDSAAHSSACEDGFTVAVLANSLDTVYPAENRKLAERILKCGGTLVSELALGERTFKNGFVRRDRIQSGLSLAVIPVQSDIEGGTMHTVRFAETQKRLLFCPTPPQQESSRKEYAGIWHLIRSGRAKPFDPEVLTQIREYKSRLVREHALVDMPLPQRPTRQQVAQEHPETSGPLVSEEELLMQKLEKICRDVGLDKNKKAFNNLLTKLRHRLFGKTPKKSKVQVSEDQGKLIE
jgi:DNA processing protein